jgi:2-succinyl-5-enolpyruvyl-6-hydroxy-3-cyclohexene-1-carboxylate synthase
MSVRDVDTFWPASERRLRMLCNRGANGIDGIVSTALGVSCASEGPTVLLTGDLAFLHDVGGLFAARQLTVSCTIVVLHDDGGGIFSFLPIAEHGESVRFRELFTLAHGLALAPAAALYGLEHERVSDAAGLRRALAASIGPPGVRVIEVPIDREANVAHHRTLWRAVSMALAKAGASA